MQIWDAESVDDLQMQIQILSKAYTGLQKWLNNKTTPWILAGLPQRTGRHLYVVLGISTCSLVDRDCLRKLRSAYYQAHSLIRRIYRNLGGRERKEWFAICQSLKLMIPK